MKLKTLTQFLNLSDTTEVEFNHIQTDSRKVSPGDLYVAIVGSRCDGNDFVADAEKNGAVAAIVSKPVNADIPVLMVPDTIQALIKCAKQWREQFNIPVVGVTGSSGKTSVKEMLASIFQAAYGKAYFATKGNFNTDITVPIMLLNLKKNHRAAVIEMGMGKPGDLTLLSDLVKPTVATINNIALVHSEFLGGLEDVARNKSEIFSGLQKNGTAVLNADEPYIKMWREKIGDKKVVTFGAQGDVSVSEIVPSFEGCEFTLTFPDYTLPVKTKLPGKHTAMNAACAAACAYAVGIDITAIKLGLEQVERPARRMQQLPGQKGSVLIDDGYNGTGVKAAIDVLSLFSGKKILILGAVRELGSIERQFHAEIGEYAKAKGVDALFAIGDIAEEAAQAFGQNAHFIEDCAELTKQVLALLDNNTCVLVKGSLSMNMKMFVDQLLA
ncbi:MAG: UDP-N-acetylmuramoyl-tripeptide--D-alanyl-D-alanine ligase [Legionellaceae bacterium]|nr:UDP-N-acetylmuramoyl-tripeptide--D-alanyl-D-alanine ligase [Legionellaceae bacterium]